MPELLPQSSSGGSNDVIELNETHSAYTILKSATNILVNCTDASYKNITISGNATWSNADKITIRNQSEGSANDITSSIGIVGPDGGTPEVSNSFTGQGLVTLQYFSSDNRWHWISSEAFDTDGDARINAFAIFEMAHPINSKAIAPLASETTIVIPDGSPKVGVLTNDWEPSDKLTIRNEVANGSLTLSGATFIKRDTTTDTVVTISGKGTVFLEVQKDGRFKVLGAID